MTQFLTHSTAIVKSFLHTAVFLDDQAEMACTVYKEASPDHIYDPNLGETVTAKQTATELVVEDNEAHRLDAETIINTFMENGIVCSVLRCTKQNKESQKENYINLMKKADLIVLDWDIHRDGGEYITEIIQNLLNEQGTIHPFRSIIIYTAESLDGVKRKLESDAKLIFGTTDPLTFTSTANKYTHVSLYNKKNSTPTISDRRSVAFKDLIETCINEFTRSFHGIVPNVAMAAIAEVRNNTHYILSKLNKDLDFAYLSHKSLLTDPDDAADLLTNIIYEEIQPLISSDRVSKHAKFDVIQHTPIIAGTVYQSIDFEKCLKQGTEKSLCEKGTKDEKKARCKELTEDIHNGNYTLKWSQNRDSNISDNIFVQLTNLRAEYSIQKQLTFGVIIANSDNPKEKLLCLQPSCDAVRLNGETPFQFLKLIQSDNNGSFDFILDDKKYKLSYNRKNRIVLTFLADSEQKKVVFNDNTISTSEEKSKSYKYIATVKPHHTQRISQEFSAHLSRVGLDESEYLRRNSTRTRRS